MDSIGRSMDKGIYNFLRRKGGRQEDLIHATSQPVNLFNN